MKYSDDDGIDNDRVTSIYKVYTSSMRGNPLHRTLLYLGHVI